MRILIETILSAATDLDRWDEALDAFNAEFGVGASCLFAVHAFEEMRMHHARSRFWRDPERDAVRRSFETGGDIADAEAYRRLVALPRQRFFSEKTVFEVEGDEDLPPSETRGLARAQGVIERAGAGLNRQGPWLDTLFVQTLAPGETERLLADERAEAVLALMANVQPLGRLVSALRARFNAALGALDRLGVGVFLVDANGAVIDRNREAERLLDQGDGLLLTRDGRLALSTADETKALELRIAAANAVAAGVEAAAVGLMAARRKSSKYDYLISIRPLKDEAAELQPGLRCAFVSVIDPAREKPISAEGLVALGALSKAEAETVELLVQGLRPQQIAERRDVGISTVWTQIKGATQKLRCSGQNDIIRVAAATRLPIEDD